MTENAPAPARMSYKTRTGSKNGVLGTAGGALGGALGTALGGPAGGLLGSTLGKLGGAALSSIFGFGDYTVSNVGSVKENNIALANAANIPQFGAGKVSARFVHREFLGDVYSSAIPGAFKIDSYPINPGLERTFPWLSGVVGAKFQQYRINGMTFEFRSMSSDALNSTNTALGSVIMATDYDSADNVFNSKQEMENTEYGVSCKPSVNMLHAIECARAQTPVTELYIRAWDVPSGKDIRFYDMGRFSIATTGCQGSNVNLGELWVTYDIECFKAIEQPPAYLAPFAMYENTGVSASAPLGTTHTTYHSSPDRIGLTFTENRIMFPYDLNPGSVFIVNIVTQANEAKALSPPLVTAGNGMSINAEWVANIPVNASTVGEWGTILAIKYDGTGTPSALPYVDWADYTWAVGSVVFSAILVTATSGELPGFADSPWPMLQRMGKLIPTVKQSIPDSALPGYITVGEHEEAKSAPGPLRLRAR